jgi:hypothetical protein
MQVLSSSPQLWPIGTQALFCPSTLLSPSKPFSCYLTLSSHPQVTSDLEPTLSIHLGSNRNPFPYQSHSPNIVHQPSMTWLIFVLITYLDKHQYSQANSLFLISSHFGLTLLTLTSISIFIFSSCSNQYLIKPNHYLSLLVHAKQATTETNPCSSNHVSFAICQIYLISHDSMISHNIEAISSILYELLSFVWTRLIP